MNRTPLDRLLALGEFATEIITVIAVGAAVVLAFRWLVA